MQAARVHLNSRFKTRSLLIQRLYPQASLQGHWAPPKTVLASSASPHSGTRHWVWLSEQGPAGGQAVREAGTASSQSSFPGPSASSVPRALVCACACPFSICSNSSSPAASPQLGPRLLVDKHNRTSQT